MATRKEKPILVYCGVCLFVGLLVGFLTGRSVTVDSNLREAASGSAHFTWVAPTENVDGSPLEDLAGFTLQCWNQSGQLAFTQVINDPSATSYSADNLPTGVYHCAVAAINTQGLESSLSNMVVKLVSPGDSGQ